LKQLGPELLTNPWDGLTCLGIKWFGAMSRNTIGLLRVKLPCNFGGWKHFAEIHNKFKWFAHNIKTNTYLRKKDLETTISFVESMQLRALWEWA
jgi:hypothetical protein